MKERESRREEGGRERKRKERWRKGEKKRERKSEKKQTHQPPWVKHQQRRVASGLPPQPRQKHQFLVGRRPKCGGGSITPSNLWPTCQPHTDGKVMRCARSRDGSRALLVPRLMSPSGPPAKKVRKLRQASRPAS